MRPAPENPSDLPLRPDDGPLLASPGRHGGPAAELLAAVEQCKGILMAVHGVGQDVAWEMLSNVSEERHCALPDLAVATVELVRGAAPTKPNAAAVALRFLMGAAAYTRPVLDGQVHPAVRGAVARHLTSDEEVEALIRAADVRDQAAERRDHVADDRDHAALAGPDQTAGEHLFDEVAREQAAIDRAWAASDRDLSAGDRADLVERLRRRDKVNPPDDE